MSGTKVTVSSAFSAAILEQHLVVQQFTKPGMVDDRSLSDVTDGLELGQIAARLLNCMDSVIHRVIQLYRASKDERQQRYLLQDFRNGM